MHYCGYIITKKIPSDEDIENILEPYNEETHEGLEFAWDYYVIGGRYGGKLKINFNPDKNEDGWYCNRSHDRNYKYFISSKLKELKSNLPYYDELENMMYMGLKERVLYVDGAYYKDINNFDITNCCFVINDDGKLYSRELWRNHEWVNDEEFEDKVKKINLENKFITVVDIHD